mgnify:CR=1 FL=1
MGKMKIFKNENTILIQGWMINILNLSGNELICFALIYGFSQDGESEFFGSLNYICSALNCSKPTVLKTLSSLIEKKIITQNEGFKIIEKKTTFSQLCHFNFLQQ